MKRLLLPLVAVLGLAGLLAAKFGLFSPTAATTSQAAVTHTAARPINADAPAEIPEGVYFEITDGFVTGIASHQADWPPSRFDGILGSRYQPGSLDETDVTRQLWRSLDLVLTKPDGSKASIQILRPLWWLQGVKGEPGEKLNLAMFELGLEGEAVLRSLGPCDVDSRENGPNQNIVIGKIEHQNAIVYDLVFNNDEENPLGVTANHPLYSNDRDDWIAAGELKLGEQVTTVGGTATLTAKTQRPGLHKVYNMEVHRSHSYYVSQFGILAHNTGIDCKRINVGPSGHHVPAVRKTVGRPFEVARSDKTRPTMFSRGSDPGHDHWRLHNAEREVIGPRQGAFAGTDDELFDAYRRAYADLDDIRVDVRSPDGRHLLGENVSPVDAVNLIENWLRQQGLR